MPQDPVIDLPNRVEYIEFSQINLIREYSESSAYLDPRGVCAGLCADYIRFYKKRETGSIYADKDILETSFLYKESLRNYVETPDSLNSKKTSSDKDLYSFARRVQLYQLYFQNLDIIKQDHTKNMSVLALFEGRKYLRFTLKNKVSAHAIVAIKMCNKDGDFLEYRLFDPNLGEYKSIKTIEDLDTVFKHVIGKYNSINIDYNLCDISDYDEFFLKERLNFEKNKNIFSFFDLIRDLEKLDSKKLKSALKALPVEVRDDIGDVIPNAKTMESIIKLAADELLSVGKSVYSILKFTKIHKDKHTKEVILNSKEYLSRSDKNGYTALHWSIQQADTEVAKELISKMSKESLAKQDQHGYTALHLATQKSYKETAKELISKMSKEDLAKQDQHGYTALHWSIQQADTEVAKELIIKMSKEDLAKQDQHGYTALHLATQKSYKETAKELISKMSKEDLAKQDQHGYTALHWSIQQADTEVAKELIIKMSKEDLAKQDQHGYTTLHIATQKSYKETAKELISKMSKEDLAKQDQHGYTALHWSIQQADTEVAKELISKMSKEDLAKKDQGGYTALQLAEALGHKEIVRALVAKEIDIHKKIRDGKSGSDVVVNARNIIATYKFLEDNKRLEPTKLMKKIIDRERPPTFVKKIKQFLNGVGPLDQKMIEQYLDEEIDVVGSGRVRRRDLIQSSSDEPQQYVTKRHLIQPNTQKKL
jgi:uncharacterized protein